MSARSIVLGSSKNGPRLAQGRRRSSGRSLSKSSNPCLPSVPRFRGVTQRYASGRRGTWIACLVLPGITIGVAVALFAIYCFADAITQVVKLFRADDTTGQRVVMILLGLVDVAAGVVAIAYPGITAGALVIVIGLWAIIGGSTQLAAAWRIRGSGSGWFTVAGLLSVIAVSC
jgi:Short repeat of unknown function (DUF308)